MRIVWFVNIALPDVNKHLGRKTGGSGFWLSSLAEHLVGNSGVDLTIISCGRYDRTERFKSNGIEHVLVPAGTAEIVGAGGAGFARRLASLVEDLGPDLVDVHGSEYAYASITPYVRRPVNVTIQGFISSIGETPHGDLSLSQVIAKQILRSGGIRATLGLLQAAITTRFRMRSERSILNENRYFIGRTEWDRQMIHRMCPNVRQYRQAWRIERPDFYEQKWQAPGITSPRIFSCARCIPAKGFHNLIAILPELVQDFPTVELRLTGDPKKSSWAAYLEKLAEKLNVSRNVRFVGYLDSSQIARELAQANVYAHPSYHDNSPNSLAEAMLVGTPCLATAVGGIPSMISHNIDGILVQPGDQRQLRDGIQRLLRNSQDAAALAAAGQARAIRRHDPKLVVKETLDAYGGVMQDWHTRTARG